MMRGPFLKRVPMLHRKISSSQQQWKSAGSDESCWCCVTESRMAEGLISKALPSKPLALELQDLEVTLMDVVPALVQDFLTILHSSLLELTCMFCAIVHRNCVIYFLIFTGITIERSEETWTLDIILC